MRDGLEKKPICDHVVEVISHFRWHGNIVEHMASVSRVLDKKISFSFRKKLRVYTWISHRIMFTIKNVILVEINIFFLSVSAVYHYLKYIIFEKSPVTCDIQYS